MLKYFFVVGLFVCKGNILQVEWI